MLGVPLARAEPVPVNVSAWIVTSPPEANRLPSMIAPTAVEDVPALTGWRSVKYAAANVGAWKLGLKLQTNGKPPEELTEFEKTPPGPALRLFGIVMFRVW